MTFPNPIEIYICPLCQQALLCTARQYVCPGRHSFDIAREGYVNLLPVQHKGSLEPGDSADMLTARRAFLARGHYAPLLQAIVSILRDTGPVVRLLDIGTGEGWYAGGLKQALNADVHGIDIAKTGVRMAAKRYRECHFAVAGSHGLPFQDHSFSHLLNVFAPLEAAEAARVLVPGGKLLRVSPGPEHLFELKSLLYASPHQHADYIPQLAGFELLSHERLHARFTLLEQAELLELIHMTPYAWKLQAEHQAELARALPLSLSLDVRLSLYKQPVYD